MRPDWIPSYATAHRWLRESRGPASANPCADCGEQAKEWSYDYSDPAEIRSVRANERSVYSLDPAHYRSLCRPCHLAFDKRMRRLRPRKLFLANAEADGRHLRAVESLQIVKEMTR